MCPNKRLRVTNLFFSRSWLFLYMWISAKVKSDKRIRSSLWHHTSGHFYGVLVVTRLSSSYNWTFLFYTTNKIRLHISLKLRNDYSRFCSLKTELLSVISLVTSSDPQSYLQQQKQSLLSNCQKGCHLLTWEKDFPNRMPEACTCDSQPQFVFQSLRYGTWPQKTLECRREVERVPQSTCKTWCCPLTRWMSHAVDNRSRCEHIFQSWKKHKKIIFSLVFII